MPCSERSCDGLDRGDLLGRRQLAAVRVVAVHAAQQRLAGDDAGLAAVDGQLLHEPVALADDLALGVGGAGQHLGEQLEQAGQAADEHRAAEAEPVGVGAGAELPAERLHVGGELRRRPPLGAGQQGVAEQLRLGGVRAAALAGRAGERDAQAQLGERHAAAADGEHAQAVVEGALGDDRQLRRARLRQRRDGPLLDGGHWSSSVRAQLEQGAGVGRQRRGGRLHLLRA